MHVCVCIYLPVCIMNYFTRHKNYEEMHSNETLNHTDT